MRIKLKYILEKITGEYLHDLTTEQDFLEKH